MPYSLSCPPRGGRGERQRRQSRQKADGVCYNVNVVSASATSLVWDKNLYGSHDRGVRGTNEPLSLMQITIIGMHRSGTSLVAGLLGLAGAYLGPEDDLMAANVSNPKGYWENLGFVRFNERILEHFGGAWHDPPITPDGWLNSAPELGNAAVLPLSGMSAPETRPDGVPVAPMDADVARWRGEAEEFVASEFGGHPVWAWKEPRATLLLPFWRSVVPGARFVICVRNPLDVAGSLAKRDGFQFEHSLALWHLYMLYALRDSAPEWGPRAPETPPVGVPAAHEDTTAAGVCIVHYEELLKSPRTVLPPILEFAGIDGSVVEQRWPEIQPFIDSGLEHHHHTAEDLFNHPRVLESTKQLYAALLANDAQRLAAAARDVGAVRPHLHDIAHFHREYIDLQAAMTKLTYDLDVARQMLEATTIQLDVKVKALEQTQATLNTRLHRMAASLSQKANRLPAAADLMRKMWR
jgi:hypothetical protein